MLALVTGGSASGKSEYAENLAVRLNQGQLVYIATMEPFDDECRRRIARHRKMRAEKQFETVECFTGLEQVALPPHATVLLECLSNLTANERYSPRGCHTEVVGHVLSGIRRLAETADNLVIVTNEVFSDGNRYDADTEQYLCDLGRLNTRLAGMADLVTEVVYTIPVVRKGTIKCVY